MLASRPLERLLRSDAAQNAETRSGREGTGLMARFLYTAFPGALADASRGQWWQCETTTVFDREKPLDLTKSPCSLQALRQLPDSGGGPKG